MNKVLEKKFKNGSLIVYDDKPKLENIISVHQTHSNIILTESDYKNSDQQADGIIFSLKTIKERDLKLAIKTADCLPILYVSDDHIGLVHAGWRGVESKIHIDSKLIDIKPNEIYIAPCISADSFEVQEDFKQQFPNSTHFIEKSGKVFFDLVKEAQSQLEECFPQAKISNSGICTLKNNQYNSYRLNKTNKRNWNIFQTRG